ncbi:MAG: hypothetical protein LZF62_430209 [Nitrospira sp.]|nr:MAG: hypothetical protein LZF62_430209 [Nitrospira sp.]
MLSYCYGILISRNSPSRSGKTPSLLAVVACLLVGIHTVAQSVANSRPIVFARKAGLVHLRHLMAASARSALRSP